MADTEQEYVPQSRTVIYCGGMFNLSLAQLPLHLPLQEDKANPLMLQQSVRYHQRYIHFPIHFITVCEVET